MTKNKRRQAIARAKQSQQSMSDDELLGRTPPPLEEQMASAKKKGKAIARISKKKLAELAEEEEAARTPSMGQVIRLIDTTAELLSRFDVGELHIDPEDAEAVERLRFKCANLLQSPEDPATTHAGDSPSTIQHYDEMFVHRAPNRLIYVLRPVEVFKVLSGINVKKKVFGFIREGPGKYPLMFTFPGWGKHTEDHPRILDSAFWTNEVLRWGGFHNHKFQKYLYDTKHGVDDGVFYASHVEGKLMLWYACYMLGKVHGIIGDIRMQIGELWRLGRSGLIMNVDIIQTEAPCKQCLAFQRKIQDYTSIQFNIIVTPNLGELKYFRDKYQYKEYPAFATATDEEDEEFEMELDMLRDKRTSSTVLETVRTKTTTQVVIPNPFTTNIAQHKPAPSISRTAQKKQIRSYTCTTKTTKSKQASAVSDSEDGEFRPPPSRKQSVCKTPPHSSRASSRAGQLSPPDSSEQLFNKEAYDYAEKLKQKKKRKQGKSMHESSDITPSKKSKSAPAHFQYDRLPNGKFDLTNDSE